MTNNDANNNFITAEMFNAGIQEIKAEMKEIRQEIRDTRNEVSFINTRIEDLKFFGTIGLAIIAILIALVAVKKLRVRSLTPHP